MHTGLMYAQPACASLLFRSITDAVHISFEVIGRLSNSLGIWFWRLQRSAIASACRHKWYDVSRQIISLFRQGGQARDGLTAVITLILQRRVVGHIGLSSALPHRYDAQSPFIALSGGASQSRTQSHQYAKPELRRKRAGTSTEAFSMKIDTSGRTAFRHQTYLMPSADLAESSTLPVPAFAVAMLSFAACCVGQKVVRSQHDASSTAEESNTAPSSTGSGNVVVDPTAYCVHCVLIRYEAVF